MKQPQKLANETYLEAYYKGASDTCLRLILTFQQLYSNTEALTVNQIIVICQDVCDEINKKK